MVETGMLKLTVQKNKIYDAKGQQIFDGWNWDKVEAVPAAKVVPLEQGRSQDGEQVEQDQVEGEQIGEGVPPARGGQKAHATGILFTRD